MSMDVRAGYKQTEIGLIPDEWDFGSLSKFWNITDCKHITAEFSDSGFPVVSIREVQSDFVDLSQPKYTSQHFYDLLIEGGRKPEPGDLIISRNATVGEVAQVADWHPAFAMGQDVCLLRRKAPDFSSGYLQALFRSATIRKQIENAMVGSTFKRMNVEQIRDLVVPFPPPDEQQHIATFLAQISALITHLDQLIAKKRDIQQAAMQQLLTGQRRLPEFSGEWEVKRLGEIAHIKTGSKNNQDKVEDGEYPFYVRSATVERINSYSHDCEAILVPGEGGIGSIFHYINGKFDVHQRVYAITQFADEVSGKYIHLYMSVRFGSHAMQNSVKATVDSLRLPTFQVFEVFLPPTMEEQTAIATLLTDMDTELTALQTRRDKARQIKQGMMQELLTGRIRLK